MSDDEKAGEDAPAVKPERTEDSPPSTTPAAEDALRQDRTKNKPDSGQNEDG